MGWKSSGEAYVLNLVAAAFSQNIHLTVIFKDGLNTKGQIISEQM